MTPPPQLTHLTLPCYPTRTANYITELPGGKHNHGVVLTFTVAACPTYASFITTVGSCSHYCCAKHSSPLALPRSAPPPLAVPVPQRGDATAAPYLLMHGAAAQCCDHRLPYQRDYSAGHTWPAAPTPVGAPSSWRRTAFEHFQDGLGPYHNLCPYGDAPHAGCCVC